MSRDRDGYTEEDQDAIDAYHRQPWHVCAYCASSKPAAPPEATPPPASTMTRLDRWLIARIGHHCEAGLLGGIVVRDGAVTLRPSFVGHAAALTVLLGVAHVTGTRERLDAELAELREVASTGPRMRVVS